MESSSSEGKEIQKKDKEIPGRIMMLLKPVHHNPFSAGPKFNWFLIKRLRTRQWDRRYFFNMSHHPRHLPKVLTTVLKTIPCKRWHNFFVLLSSRDFKRWRKRFPMATMNIAKNGNLQYPTDAKEFRKKLKGNSKKKNGKIKKTKT